jgi:hypothetical protein
LVTANSAAALALELAMVFADAAHLAALAHAAMETSHATHLGIHALRAPEALHLRTDFAHSAAHASHEIAGVLGLRTAQVAPDASPLAWERHGHRFPTSWRAVIEGLGLRLADPEREDPDAAAHAAFAAYDGAKHVVRVYDGFRPRDGLDGALCRYARITALASGYAGWSLTGASDGHAGPATL